MQVTVSLKRISHAATCVLLSAVLASGVFVANALSPKVEDAHAVAFAIPAAAAAVGIGDAEAIAAMSAIAGVLGFSLSSYVGATSDDVSNWTATQMQKAKGLWEEWEEELLNDAGNPLWDYFADHAEWSPDPEDPKPEPPKDKKDYNDSPLWRAAVLVNQGLLGVSALGFFADGLKNILSLNGSLIEISDYPDLIFSDSGVTFSAKVMPFSAFSDFDFSHAQDVWKPLDAHYSYYRQNVSSPSQSSVFFFGGSLSGIASISTYGNGYRFELPLSSSGVGGSVSMSGNSAVNGYSSNSLFLFFYPDSSGVMRFSETALSPQIATIIDKTYTNTTKLDSKHEIADAPQAISGWDITQMQDYLNQIGSDVSSGLRTVVKPTTTTVRNTYNENITKTDTKLEPVDPTPEPDPEPGLVIPDNYHFPNSWADGTINWNRIFPIFFFDDIYTLCDKWFPESAYDGRLRFQIPGSVYGKPKESTVITLDFRPFDKYHDVIYYGLLAVFFVNVLARMFSWWTGFSMASSSSSSKED